MFQVPKLDCSPFLMNCLLTACVVEQETLRMQWLLLAAVSQTKFIRLRRLVFENRSKYTNMRHLIVMLFFIQHCTVPVNGSQMLSMLCACSVVAILSCVVFSEFAITVDMIGLFPLEFGGWFD